ncbi:MAG: universal stress protein [Chloroflexota bacterium]
MHTYPSTSYELAVRDFQRARKSAVLRQILARLQGQSSELLDYETICRQLQPLERTIDRGLMEIPLDKIVGSVGRYRDFTREFLPKQQSDEARWAQVKVAMTDMTGVPPIEVYQIGDAYFVLDGNHRVSVARKLGAKTISAYVSEVTTRVSFSADDDPDEIICKARYANFLAQTNLDQHIPNIDLLMSLAGHYQSLLRQIDLHYQKMLHNHKDEQQVAESSETRESVPPPISWEEAALSWYRSVYLPVIQVVRELGVMRRFPNRTETDIYILLSERRDELEKSLGWSLELAESLPTLIHAQTHMTVGAKPAGYLSKATNPAGPDPLENVRVGSWRLQQLAMGREGRLFADLLVLFEGIDEDWRLLEAALELAAADHDRILALHIVDEPSQLERQFIQDMVARFDRRCRSLGLTGQFAVEAGDPLRILLKRVAWSDLLFINLTHPPESNVLDRLRSFWGPIITRCPRPLLITPHANFHGMSPLLLAYDGSPKADEALFVATYHASRWGHELAVLTVETPHTKADALTKAKAYLERHQVQQAHYILRSGEKSGHIGKIIMDTAAQHDSNVIILGGFGARPAMRLLRGSSIEYVLQHSVEQSIMICQ